MKENKKEKEGEDKEKGMREEKVRRSRRRKEKETRVNERVKANDNGCTCFPELFQRLCELEEHFSKLDQLRQIERLLGAQICFVLQITCLMPNEFISKINENK